MHSLIHLVVGVTFGNHMENNLKALGKHLECIWESFEQHLFFVGERLGHIRESLETRGKGGPQEKAEIKAIEIIIQNCAI